MRCTRKLEDKIRIGVYGLFLVITLIFFFIHPPIFFFILTLIGIGIGTLLLALMTLWLMGEINLCDED